MSTKIAIDSQIMIDSEQWNRVDHIDDVIHQAMTATLSTLGFQDITSELSIVLTDDTRIRTINKEWRQKDTATNVLSFPAFEIKPGEKPGPMLGDIIVAYETVAHEAQEENKPFDHHFSHLIVHGLLHLLGYDHENDSEAEEMEGLEVKILQTLAIADPYTVSHIKNV